MNNENFNSNTTLQLKKPLAWDFIKGHIDICRFDHWIKNIFILPGTLIAIQAGYVQFTLIFFVHFFLGVLAVGLIASSNYVINEVLDAPYDLKHHTKFSRPVPSGRVKIPLAYVQWIVLMILGIILASLISFQLTIVLGALWVMGCVYNISPIRTKDLPYLDVVSESVNNPIRMLAGWYICTPPVFPSLNLLLSYWMIGCYLMALKRFAEYREISSHNAAVEYRKSFKFYNETRLLVSIMFYSAAGMLFFGAFIMRYKMELVLAFPFIAWVMAVYMQLAFKKDSAVQAPEKLYKEPLLMASVTICSLIMIVLLFTNMPFLSDFFSPTLKFLN